MKIRSFSRPQARSAGWLIVLLALLWFIARLTGRGSAGKSPKARISN